VAAHLAFGLVVIAAEQIAQIARIAPWRTPAASENPVLNAGKGAVCPKISISSHQTAQKPSRAQNPPFLLTEHLVVPGFKRAP